MNRLNGTEEVTRFIFDDDHYSQPNKKDLSQYRIKKNAVSPTLNSIGEYETSVMLTSKLSETETLSLGNDYVAKKRGQALFAYLTFSNSLIEKNSLYVENDKNGHDRHCAIKGWPASKEDWMEKSDDLAKAITADSNKIFKVL